jgi:hypothetical protein
LIILLRILRAAQIAISSDVLGRNRGSGSGIFDINRVKSLVTISYVVEDIRDIYYKRPEKSFLVIRKYLS